MCFVLMVWAVVCVFFLFFFRQQTAYGMRISDWSSDVCSSDLWLGGSCGVVDVAGSVAAEVRWNADGMRLRSPPLQREGWVGMGFRRAGNDADFPGCAADAPSLTGGARGAPLPSRRRSDAAPMAPGRDSGPVLLLVSTPCAAHFAAIGPARRTGTAAGARRRITIRGDRKSVV